MINQCESVCTLVMSLKFPEERAGCSEENDDDARLFSVKPSKCKQVKRLIEMSVTRDVNQTCVLTVIQKLIRNPCMPLSPDKNRRLRACRRPKPLTLQPLLESGWIFFQQVDRNTALKSPQPCPCQQSINVKIIINILSSPDSQKICPPLNSLRHFSFFTSAT